jgi:hypothetical protein
VIAPNDLCINEAGSSESFELLVCGHVQNPVTRSVGSGWQVIADQHFRARSEERRQLCVQPRGVALVSQFMDRL